MEPARPAKKTRRVEAKKAYRGPTLVVYGSITKLTQSSSGSGADGGIIRAASMTPCL
jgi:hypothetical protein